MRQLLTFITPEGMHQMLERRPGPYSYSAPVYSVVFEMTAEEADAVQPLVVGDSPVIPQSEVAPAPPPGDQTPADAAPPEPGAGEEAPPEPVTTPVEETPNGTSTQ